MRLRPVVVLVAALALLAAGCGAAEEPEAPPEPPAEPSPPEEEPREPEEDGPEPVGEWTVEERESGDYPREAGHAQLTGVRASQHEAGADHPGFDRVVLEFAGEAGPSWRVARDEPPIVEDPSGIELEVEGAAFLRISMHPASAIDLTGEQPRETYEGPDRIRVDGHVVTELVLVTDHHGALAWVLGLQREAPVAVALLEDPPRLVVDVVDE